MTDEVVDGAPPHAEPVGLHSNKRFYLLFAALLLMLYLTPMALALYASYTTDGFARDDSALEFFSAFLRQPDSTLNLFHKILFPTIVGISTFAFKDGAAGPGAIALVGLLLASLAISIFAGVAFEIPRVLIALEALKDAPPAALIKSYFSRTQEVLLMYLMTILGLHAASKK